jgi:hypothetical protein
MPEAGTAGADPPGRSPDEEWSGTRPLVDGPPLVVGVFLAVAAFAVLVFALTRDPGVVSRLASHYVATMAGSLSPEMAFGDPADLSAALTRAGAGFTPHIESLEPEFTLLGGDVHELNGRPIAAWFYRDGRADMLLAEAFVATLGALGEADDVRRDREPALHIFRKTNQTLVFWQEDAVVYVLIATLPGERTVTLARRLASRSPR